VKIGVFDSGIGGITVLNELTARMPAAEFLYFGDTANVPYGTKSETQIQNLVSSASARMRTRELDALVIACNTAASLARPQIDKIFPDIPVIDAVEAGVLACLRAMKHRESDLSPLLILGTRATVKSHVYARLLKAENPALLVIEQECPLLVPMIEEGWIDHPVLLATVDVYTKIYQTMIPGVALLACTHYPWIKKAFQNALPGWMILDSAQSVAEILCEQLPEDLLAKNSRVDESVAESSPTIRWFFSDPESVSRTLLKSEPDSWVKF
jgi:glutamate racemase